jgi:hypothetical protein
VDAALKPRPGYSGVLIWLVASAFMGTHSSLLQECIPGALNFSFLVGAPWKSAPSSFTFIKS